MNKIHPLLRDFIGLFYDGDVDEFVEEYEELVGEKIDLEMPSAGLVKFVRLKWGLSSDMLLGLKDIKNNAIVCKSSDI